MPLHVDCVIKVHRGTAQERITHIGGTAVSGMWRHSAEQAMENIAVRAGFYSVSVKERLGRLVVRTRNGQRELGTTFDTAETQHLRSLPSCL